MKKIIIPLLILAGALGALPQVISFWSVDNSLPLATDVTGGGDTVTTNWQPSGDYSAGSLFWYITNIQDSVKFRVRFTPEKNYGWNAYCTPWHDVYVVDTDTFSMMGLEEIPPNTDSTWSGWPEHGWSQWQVIGYGGSTSDTTEVRAGLDLEE